ncbi:unnamed protein product [Ixodes pacificus]
MFRHSWKFNEGEACRLLVVPPVGSRQVIHPADPRLHRWLCFGRGVVHWHKLGARRGQPAVPCTRNVWSDMSLLRLAELCSTVHRLTHRRLHGWSLASMPGSRRSHR